jgi:hypothetical protein
VQAAGRDSAEADQHRLAPRRAERTEPRLAHDLATEAVGQDQPFFGRQQSKREIARNREIEALPTIPRRIRSSLIVRVSAAFQPPTPRRYPRLYHPIAPSRVANRVAILPPASAPDPSHRLGHSSALLGRAGRLAQAVSLTCNIRTGLTLTERLGGVAELVGAPALGGCAFGPGHRLPSGGLHAVL